MQCGRARDQSTEQALRRIRRHIKIRASVRARHRSGRIAPEASIPMQAATHIVVVPSASSGTKRFLKNCAMILLPHTLVPRGSKLKTGGLLAAVVLSLAGCVTYTAIKNNNNVTS